ncbi:hypothetical protein K458DRAFT_401018 [Lentithecium fluviatile CBS 122367]|uniref:Uncharacterized protein n=1 Tax=Lentithecium fluviatile CBS 122367 TaxID=1168545 RepID=A0A6G1JEE0_9PLEO|nr:hypothetical protein K458DRAFT_401018 [Lentithecium fluviatile CBS 122367]
MAITNTPRRSRRLVAKKDAVPAAVSKPSTRHSKPICSTSTKTAQLTTWLRHRSTSSTSTIDLDLPDSKLATQTPKARPKPKPKSAANYKSKPSTKPSAAHFADSASSSDSSTDSESSDEGDSDDEYGELADLSADNLEWSTADEVDVGRHLSYDSRCEPGNEDYEMDEFVIGDEEGVGVWSEREDEDVEVDEEEDEYEDDLEVGDGNATDAHDTRRQEPEIRIKSRRSSNESKLFFSDPDDKSNPLALPSLSDLGFEVEAKNELLVAEANADIVEEIVGALTLFPRRCNRGRKPVRLRLAAGVLEDREVREALESALRLGLGRKISLRDGSKWWKIGPNE